MQSGMHLIQFFPLIWRSLRFTNPKEYNQWLSDNLINFGTEEGNTPLERREIARKELGLPTDEEVEEMVAKKSVNGRQKGVNDLKPEQSKFPKLANESEDNVLKFGPDFRSVNLNGRVYAATSKQAEVLSLLYDQWGAGTHFVSQSFLIEEVYPVATTNNLKKLFSNNQID